MCVDSRYLEGTINLIKTNWSGLKGIAQINPAEELIKMHTRMQIIPQKCSVSGSPDGSVESWKEEPTEGDRRKRRKEKSLRGQKRTF